MKTIYIDSLFLLNLIVDYLLLLSAARVCSLPPRRWRLLAGAALGAGVSAVYVLPGGGFLASPLVLLCVSMGMCLASFGGERRLGRAWGTFLAVSAAFGGAVWASQLALGGRGAGPYAPISLRLLLPSFALSWAAITLIFRKSRRRAQRRIVEVRVSLNGAEAAFPALVDTGNELRDPISGMSCLVADGAALSPLFPAGALDGGDAVEITARLNGAMRLVPYSAVGQSGALLPVFRPDGLLVAGEERRDLLVALCPTAISGGGDYRAIIQEG